MKYILFSLLLVGCCDGNSIRWVEISRHDDCILYWVGDNCESQKITRCGKDVNTDYDERHGRTTKHIHNETH